ncbi:ATP-binding protein [Bradyrhizobium sp. LHD-71]|uniref:ATP-binding protein n=1 Tax=Bradyrhizobium sp. LHD-71 TaxID=3072141 RepID=UPI00280C8D7F|nr:ATP-binding protein [Bradyrhizobium sp. LHD-71]MDQ8726873.1 response regulator [Bradyrhizobium sp. LHD-71]
MLIETLAPRISHQANDAVARPKILIADDDSRNLMVLDTILTAPDREVVQARSGWDVLSQVRQNDFAVVILDVRMPDLDGFQVAARMKTDQRTSRIPVIFVTAYDRDEPQIASGYAAGAIDYVFKPINPKFLRSKVDILLDLYRKTEEVRWLAQQEKRLLLENLRIQKEKTAAEQRLREREEHQSLVLQSLPIALYTATCGSGLRRLRFTNDSIRRLSGFSSADFLRQPNLWEARLNPEEHGRVTRAFADIDKAGSVSIEYRWRCADGSEKYVFDHAVLSELREDGSRELFGFWLDVSDRRSLETGLLHASKLEAVGRLTGGIVHDFRNMLSVVIGNLDLLQLLIRDNSGASRRLRSALEGAQTCAELTSRLLAFVRHRSIETDVVDVVETVESIMDLLDCALGANIKLHTNYDKECWPVCADRPQLEAAIVNLAINARDAMPDGGELSIRVENVCLAADHRDRQDEQAPEYVRITVSDTGVGMPAATVERIFEPFFTTKDNGKGNGLGLSMVRHFARQSNGNVSVRSVPNVGTRISIELPRARLEPPYEVEQPLFDVSA